MTELVPAAAVKVGDMVDLEGDTYADPNRDSLAFECEYAIVFEVDRETADCVAIYFDGCAFGFPPDHLLKVEGHKEECAASAREG